MLNLHFPTAMAMMTPFRSQKSQSRKHRTSEPFEHHAFLHDNLTEKYAANDTRNA